MIEVDTPRFLFAEWSCAEGSDPTDFENWKISNPSLGVKGIAPVERLREDFETNMSLQMFAREHLGMWDDPRMNSVIPMDSWDECKLPDIEDITAPGGVRPPVVELGLCVASVDVAPDQEFASIAVAGRRPDGRAHVEVIANSPGVKWLVREMTRLIASSNPPAAVGVQAGAAAGAFGSELEEIGYEVHYLGTQDVARATAQFYKDVVNGELTHLDDPFLLEGLAGAAKYSIGKPELEQWGWLRKDRSADITGIVAVSYANRILTLKSTEVTQTTKKRYRMI